MRSLCNEFSHEESDLQAIYHLNLKKLYPYNGFSLNQLSLNQNILHCDTYLFIEAFHRCFAKLCLVLCDSIFLCEDSLAERLCASCTEKMPLFISAGYECRAPTATCQNDIGISSQCDTRHHQSHPLPVCQASRCQKGMLQAIIRLCVIWGINILAAELGCNNAISKVQAVKH